MRQRNTKNSKTSTKKTKAVTKSTTTTTHTPTVPSNTVESIHPSTIPINSIPINNHQLPTSDHPKSSHPIEEYLWCSLCGKEFELVDDPLEQEFTYFTHYTAEHLIDDMDDGSINEQDLTDLEQFYSNQEYNKNIWKNNAITTETLQKDKLLYESKQHYDYIEKRKFWFAVFVTIILTYIVWSIVDTTNDKNFWRSTFKSMVNMMS